jgi:prepilin-type processing-associated H-X9-DG protein
MKTANTDWRFYKRLDERTGAFTIVELMVVVALIAILAGILLPALSQARQRANAIFCLNNTRQLVVAWDLYATDNNGRFAYNFGGTGDRGLSGLPRTFANWVNNVLTWDLESDNTNVASVTEASLGPYTAKSAKIYRCPMDDALSYVQQNARWKQRVRSYSMNAMVGDAGDLSKTGFNVNNPYYTQFFMLSAVPEPSEIFVFIEEHPDSINDGYFLNKAYSKSWIDLPSARHNGAGSVSFADGHGELHPWVNDSTMRPEEPGAAGLPFKIPQTSGNYLADYNWVIRHMSVHRD